MVRKKKQKGEEVNTKLDRATEELLRTDKAGDKVKTFDDGCNCPEGCIKGEPILPSAVLKADKNELVHISCSNEDCPQVPYIHVQCCDNWEEALVKAVHHCRSLRTRSWTPHQIREFLWDKKVYELAKVACRCRCTGLLRRMHQDEKAENARVKTPKQNTRDLPRLNVPNYGKCGKTAGGGFQSSKFNVAPAVRLLAEQKAKENQSDEQEEKELTVPVGARGWRTQLYNEPPEPAPLVRPSGSSSVASGGHLSDTCASATVIGTRGLIAKLEILMNEESAVWVGDRRVHSILGECCAELMVDITDAGGLEYWLPLHTDSLIVHHNKLMLNNGNAGSALRQLRTTGEVAQVDAFGTTGIINCPHFDCQIAFSATETSFCGTQYLQPNDLIVFKAEERTDLANKTNCAYVAIEVDLLQRLNPDELPATVSQQPQPQPRTFHPVRDQLEPEPMTEEQANQLLADLLAGNLGSDEENDKFVQSQPSMAQSRLSKVAAPDCSTTDPYTVPPPAYMVPPPPMFSVPPPPFQFTRPPPRLPAVLDTTTTMTTSPTGTPLHQSSINISMDGSRVATTNNKRSLTDYGKTSAFVDGGLGRVACLQRLTDSNTSLNVTSEDGLSYSAVQTSSSTNDRSQPSATSSTITSRSTTSLSDKATKDSPSSSRRQREVFELPPRFQQLNLRSGRNTGHYRRYGFGSPSAGNQSDVNERQKRKVVNTNGSSSSPTDRPDDIPRLRRGRTSTINQ